jgi:hypothetical protein
VAGFDLAHKGRAGDAIIMRWKMTTTTMARGGSTGKVLMKVFQSISAQKLVTYFTLSLFIIPINNNCSSVSVTRLQVLRLCFCDYG